MREKELWDSAGDRQEQQYLEQQAEKLAQERAKWVLYKNLTPRRTQEVIRREDEARYPALAASLKRLRRRAGLNQATAAYMMARPQSWIAKIESTRIGTKRRPATGGKIDYVEMERLAVVYGCTLRDFRTAEPEQFLGVRAEENGDKYLGLSNETWTRAANNHAGEQIKKRQRRQAKPGGAHGRDKG